MAVAANSSIRTAAAAAIILPAIARNKVSGLALTKVINLASIVPLIAIVPSPLRLLAGVVPSFWVGELLDLSGQPLLPFAAAAALALALATHAVAVAGLFWLLGRRAG